VLHIGRRDLLRRHWRPRPHGFVPEHQQRVGVWPLRPGLGLRGAQPDWYMLFLEGTLRLMPGWEFVIGGYTLSLNILVPGAIIPGVLITFFGAYPFIERYVTKDTGEHHILDRPRNVPVRTSLGVAVLTAFLVTLAAGANDLIDTHF